MSGRHARINSVGTRHPSGGRAETNSCRWKAFFRASRQPKTRPPRRRPARFARLGLLRTHRGMMMVTARHCAATMTVSLRRKTSGWRAAHRSAGRGRHVAAIAKHLCWAARRSLHRIPGNAACAGAAATAGRLSEPATAGLRTPGRRPATAEARFCVLPAIARQARTWISGAILEHDSLKLTRRKPRALPWTRWGQVPRPQFYLFRCWH